MIKLIEELSMNAWPALQTKLFDGWVLRFADGIVCVNKIVDGRIVGCGFGVIEHDYIGIFDIIVDKSYRGKGFGRNIMNGILNIAQEKGIGTAYLQVVVGNKVAENLYESLGFQEEYRYWYRVKKA